MTEPEKRIVGIALRTNEDGRMRTAVIRGTRTSFDNMVERGDYSLILPLNNIEAEKFAEALVIAAHTVDAINYTRKILAK